MNIINQSAPAFHNIIQYDGGNIKKSANNAKSYSHYEQTFHGPFTEKNFTANIYTAAPRPAIIYFEMILKCSTESRVRSPPCSTAGLNTLEVLPTERREKEDHIVLVLSCIKVT